MPQAEEPPGGDRPACPGLAGSLDAHWKPGRPAGRSIAARHSSAMWPASRRTDSGLAPAPEDESWIEALPVGLLRDVADRIRHGDADPGVKVRALLDLYALVGETRS